jgi:hypothetical protein
MSGIVVALTDSMVGNGTRQPVVIRKGEAWDGSDPIVKANPSLFSSDPPRARRTTPREEVVEQATRAPGEKSRARRAR